MDFRNSRRGHPIAPDAHGRIAYSSSAAAWPYVYVRWSMCGARPDVRSFAADAVFLMCLCARCAVALRRCGDSLGGVARTPAVKRATCDMCA